MSEDSTVPLIDFNQFLHGSTDERERVASIIDEAFRSVGFLYLCNHGIDEEKVNECFRRVSLHSCLPSLTPCLLFSQCVPSYNQNHHPVE